MNYIWLSLLMILTACSTQTADETQMNNQKDGRQNVSKTDVEPAKNSKSIVVKNFQLSMIQDANSTARLEAQEQGDASDSAWLYSPMTQNLKDVDLDGDGDLDAVLIITICEMDSCHQTSQLSAVALLENDGKSYNLNWQKNVDFDPEIEQISGPEVTIKSLIYGEQDPQCCPSVPVKTILKFRQ